MKQTSAYLFFFVVSGWTGVSVLGQSDRDQNSFAPAGAEVTIVDGDGDSSLPSAQSAGATAGSGLNYSTGFEPEEGFVPGFIGGGTQPAGCGGVASPCWGTTTSANSSLTEGHIDTVHPHSGMQHLRISHDPERGVYNPPGHPGVNAFYPWGNDLIEQPAAPSVISMRVSIDFEGEQEFRVQPISSQGVIIGSVRFLYDGSVYYYDYCEDPFEPHPLNGWFPGVYSELEIELDACNGQVSYVFRGGPRRTACTPATNIAQVSIWGDNYPGSSMDIDDLSITTGEPCPVFGACCDTNGIQQGCIDAVLEADCLGRDKVWTADALCQDLDCVCVPECTDRQCGSDGCGGSCGSCSDGVLCNGLESCSSEGQCLPGIPPACDNGLYCDGIETCHPNFGCVTGPAPNCDDGIDCTVDACNEPDGTCTHNDADCAIPTVSEWGLVVLAIVLLVTAKVQFGRRRLA